MIGLFSFVVLFLLSARGGCFKVQECPIKLNFVTSEDEGVVFQRSHSLHFKVDINLKFDMYLSDEPHSVFQVSIKSLMGQQTHLLI